MRQLNLRRPPPRFQMSLRFEDALTELQRIVAELEDGRGSLDESLARFERAVGLVQQCRRLLSEAEQRIEIVSGRSVDGPLATRPIELEATHTPPPVSTGPGRSAASSEPDTPVTETPSATGDNDELRTSGESGSRRPRAKKPPPPPEDAPRPRLFE